jgi:hypothetical protein
MSINYNSFRDLLNYEIFQHKILKSQSFKKRAVYWYFYATLANIRHFIFAGCYDNDPWYLVTNLAGHLELAGHLDFAGHLDLAGFYFSKCSANFNHLLFHLVI